MALQLILHVLLHPVSLRRYLEGTAADAPLRFDLDLLTDLLLQQLGDGRSVEHSQHLALPAYTERDSLQLLPRTRHPALPLLPHWMLLPLLKLRFRPVGESVASSPVVAATEGQVIALLQFLLEMERCDLHPLTQEEKPMRYYCLLHLLCASSEVVNSSVVIELVHALLPFYQTNLSDKECTQHQDCLVGLDSLIPQEEMMALLQKSCNLVLDEFYECPLVYELLFLFFHPCRGWNYRVLLLNFFYDNDLCTKLLVSNSLLVCNGNCNEEVKTSGVNEVLRRVYADFSQSYKCVWETKEEVMEMFIRYFEKCQSSFRNGQHGVAINNFMFQLLHYIEAKSPRYTFFAREIERVYPTIRVHQICHSLNCFCLLKK